MRSFVVRAVVVLLSVALLPSLVRGGFLSTTLDGGSVTYGTRAITEGSYDSWVRDSVSATAPGNGLPVPMNQWITVDVALPAGTAIRVAANSDYYIELTLGAPDLGDAGFVSLTSSNGDVTVDVSTGPANLRLGRFEQGRGDGGGGETVTFRMTSETVYEWTNSLEKRIDGFSFRFIIHPDELLPEPRLLADELRLTVRGSTFAAHDEAATRPPVVTFIPEPAATLPLAITLAAATLRRRRRRGR